MSEPIHYVKDSQLFTVVIEDFASRMNGRMYRRKLGYAGGDLWYLYFNREVEDMVRYLNVSIRFDVNKDSAQSINAHYGFYVGDRLHRSFSTFEKSVLESCNFHLETLLDERNGFLEDGALKIQVEIRVLAFTFEDGIRRFNFYDPFEGCVELWSERRWSSFYVGKTLISHHCPFFAKEISEGKSKIEIRIGFLHVFFESFLQLLHGVPLRFETFFELKHLIRIAHHLQVNNVLQYCCVELSTGGYQLPEALSDVPKSFVWRVIKTIDNEVIFRDYVKGRIEYLDEMNKELLNTIVWKFFSFAADNDKETD